MYFLPIKGGRFVLWAAIVLSWLGGVDGYAGDPLSHWTWRNPLPAGNTLYAVTHAANQFVAVGDQGAILSSPDGTNWTTQGSANRNTLNDVTHGHGLFVAVGENGTIITSADAENWDARSSSTTVGLTAVAFGNNRFVAIAGDGTIHTSADGLVWLQVPFQTNGLKGIAFGNGLFLTLRDVNSQVLSSVDGLTWSPTASLPSGIHSRIHFGNGTFLVASQLGGILRPVRIFFSNNGTDWGTNTPPFRPARFVSGGGITLGVGGTSALLSTNGQSWTSVSIPSFPGGFATTYGNGTYVDVGPAGSVASTSDIYNWTNHLQGSLHNVGGESMSGIAATSNVVVTVGAQGMHVSTNNSPFAIVPEIPVLNDVTYGLGAFVAVGGSSVFKSSNGINWTPYPSGTPNGLNAVTPGPDGFVAVGGGGAIRTSPNGQTWTGRFSPVQTTLHGVAFYNGLYVAVGDSGTVLTSSNRVDWEVQDPDTLSNLRDVAGGSAGFVAVGDQGTLLTSSNAINWTQRLSGHWLFDTVSFGNGFYMAGGFYWPEDFIFSSIDGLTWKRQHPPGRLALIFTQTLGSTFDGTHFWLAGQGGTVLQSGSTATPMLSARALADDDVCEITIAGGTVGSVYTLQCCSQLRSPWQNLVTFTNLGSSTCYNDVGAKSRDQSFYRVIPNP